MKRIAVALLAAVLGLGLIGASPATEGTRQVIDLKDGGILVIRPDGTMYHTDAAGTRVRMRDGVTMEAKDGTRYAMKNDVIWKQITETGTLNPMHP